MFNVRLKSLCTLAVLYVFALLFCWGAACYFKLVDPLLLPSPVQVAGVAYKLLLSGELQHQILVSLERMLFGFFLGAGLALIVGFLCGVSKKIGHWLEPLIYLAYPIPRFALLPFIMLMFGVGMMSKVVFIGLAAFFPIAINTISGIANINENYLEAARHYGASGWKLYKRVILPASLPSIFTGVRISLGITVSTTTVIEFLTSTDGLGAMIWLSLQALRIDRMFLGVIIVVFFNLMLVLLLKVLEHLFIPWNRDTVALED